MSGELNNRKNKTEAIPNDIKRKKRTWPDDPKQGSNAQLNNREEISIKLATYTDPHSQSHSAVIVTFMSILCYVMLCYVMLCYVMLCYVMLCYVMLGGYCCESNL